jgi:hypothetical protein
MVTLCLLGVLHGKKRVNVWQEEPCVSPPAWAHGPAATLMQESHGGPDKSVSACSLVSV